MKRILTVILLVCCVNLYAQQNFTVALTPFDLVGDGVTQEEANVIYELFLLELSNISGIRVVDRNSFDRIIAEMQFQVSDWSDSNKVAELGRARNIDVFIRGQFMSFAGRLIITTRVVDVNTTDILSGAPLQLNSIEELPAQLPAYAANVMKNLPSAASGRYTGDLTRIPPQRNPFAGEWTGSIEGFDFNILFMYSNMCLITVKAVQDGRRITEEAEGTWTYDNNIMRVNVTFPSSKIQGLSRISWSSVYSFINNDNTAFSMLITPPGKNSQSRISFARIYSY